MFHKILVANDGSENAFKAVRTACQLAKAFKAELHMIVVEEVLEIAEVLEEVKDTKATEDKRVREYIKRAQVIAGHVGVTLTPHVFSGHVVRTVVDFANDNAFELLVIGATGHAAFHERMLGTRADRIAHLANCPVLIVR